MSSHAALSCLVCRSRKVKCDRSLPTCKRCQASDDAQCVYRSRQPREKKARKIRPRSSASPSRAVSQDALAIIWERLRRIEENTERSEFQPSASGTPRPQSGQYSDAPAVSIAEDGSTRPTLYGTRMPDMASLSPFDLSPAASTLHLAGNVPTPRAPSDIVALLNGAVDEAMRLKAESLGISNMYLLEDVTIPAETARGWVENFFSKVGPRFWPAIKDEALVDVKLLHMLPDLLQMKHGQYLTDYVTKERIDEDPLLSRKIYISCLRAISIWQRQATGSEIDIIAATFMAQVAAENLDPQLCWNMHKCACEWSEALELHNADSVEAQKTSLLGRTDSGRMSLWNLVQIELFFRLCQNREAAFSFDLVHWRVNFPFLIFDEEVDIEEAMPNTAFLAGSRVTLILIRFFQKMEDDLLFPDRLSEVLSLCQRVEQAVQEWRIFDWHQSFKQQTVNGWYLSELALNCYSSVLFMLRRVAEYDTHNHDESPSLSTLQILAKETLIYTSRRVILIVCHMIQIIKLPESPALSIALSMYAVHEAYADIATHVLDQTPAAAAADDVMLLKRFGRCMRGVASKATEFVPMAQVLKSLEALLET